jgi:hypothetical protein
VEGFKAREYARPVLLRWHTPINRAFITQAPPALGPGTSTLAQLKARRSRRDAAARSGPVAHRTDQAVCRTGQSAVRPTGQVAARRTRQVAVSRTGQAAVSRTGQFEVFEPWFPIEYVDTRHAA